MPAASVTRSRGVIYARFAECKGRVGRGVFGCAGHERPFVFERVAVVIHRAAAVEFNRQRSTPNGLIDAGYGHRPAISGGIGDLRESGICIGGKPVLTIFQRVE